MRPGRDNIASPDLPTDLSWVGVEPESMPALTAGGPALVHFVEYAQLPRTNFFTDLTGLGGIGSNDLSISSEPPRDVRLDTERKRFDVGMSTSFLVIQAQRDLAQAKQTELAAVLGYDLALVEFEAIQRAAPDNRQ